jgi:hypothetical protein
MTLKDMISTVPPEFPRPKRTLAIAVTAAQWPWYRHHLKHLTFTPEVAESLSDAFRK